jgi:hypothetical protein
MRASMLCDIGDVLFNGDSVPGDGSVMEEESRVEMVVVGEESEDSEADVDVLSRCWWNTEKGAFIELKPVSVVARSLRCCGLPFWDS